MQAKCWPLPPLQPWECFWLLTTNKGRLHPLLIPCNTPGHLPGFCPSGICTSVGQPRDHCPTTTSEAEEDSVEVPGPPTPGTFGSPPVRATPPRGVWSWWWVLSCTGTVGTHPHSLVPTGVSQRMRPRPRPGGQGHSHALIPPVLGWTVHRHEAVRVLSGSRGEAPDACLPQPRRPLCSTARLHELLASRQLAWEPSCRAAHLHQQPLEYQTPSSPFGVGGLGLPPTSPWPNSDGALGSSLPPG